MQIACETARGEGRRLGRSLDGKNIGKSQWSARPRLRGRHPREESGEKARSRRLERAISRTYRYRYRYLPLCP